MASESATQEARPALTGQQEDAATLCSIVLSYLKHNAGGGPSTPEELANLYLSNEANPNDCQDSQVTLNSLVSAGLVTVEGGRYSLKPCFIDWPKEKLFTVWAAFMTREVWPTRPNLLDELLWADSLPPIPVGR